MWDFLELWWNVTLFHVSDSIYIPHGLRFPDSILLGYGLLTYGFLIDSLVYVGCHVLSRALLKTMFY
jgi:hypothetical protein